MEHHCHRCDYRYPAEYKLCPMCSFPLVKRGKGDVQLNFGQALALLQSGMKVKRKDWGGYWFIAHDPRAGEEVHKSTSLHHEFSLNKLIVAKLKDDGGYAPAQPYQADLLAEDWEVVG